MYVRLEGYNLLKEDVFVLKLWITDMDGNKLEISHLHVFVDLEIWLEEP